MQDERVRQSLPFKDFGHVLAFVIHANPARFQRVDFSDTIRGAEPHPLKDWNIIAAHLFREIKKYKDFTARCHRSGEAFERYHLKQPPDDIEDIAHDFGVSTRTVRRHLRESWDYLESRFKALEAIP